MVLVQKEIKKVYLGDTQVRPASPATIDYINETWAWETWQNTNWYYYGIAFTPKVNCTLDKIIFWWSTSGTLKITQSDYASSAWTTYSISNVSEYILSTQMQLTANTRYTISVNWTTTYSNDIINYPISWTNVTFDYITMSYGNQGYNWFGQTVRWIQTTAT